MLLQTIAKVAKGRKQKLFSKEASSQADQTLEANRTQAE